MELYKFVGQVAATVAFVLALKYLAKLLWHEFKREFELANPKPPAESPLRQEVITLEQLFNGLFHLYALDDANSIEIVRNTDDGISNAVWELTIGNRDGMASPDPIVITQYHETIVDAYNELVRRAAHESR